VPGERDIMEISHLEVKVSLWGVGAMLCRRLLWCLISVNLVNLVQRTWTSLTPDRIMAYGVPLMMISIIGIALCDSADREACR
jgi:hypothetical protein